MDAALPYAKKSAVTDATATPPDRALLSRMDLPPMEPLVGGKTQTSAPAAAPLPTIEELLKMHPADAQSPACLYYAVDIEGTGPSKATNYMIQLGAVAFVIRDGTLVPVGAFSVALMPPSAVHCFDPKCMAEFWQTRLAHLDKLKGAAFPPAAAMDLFLHWLDGFKAARMVQLTDFTQYDSSWIDHYATFHSEIKGPLYLWRGRLEPAVCTDDAYRALLKDFASPWVSTSAACKAAGVEFFDPGNAHDAVYDAYGIGVNFLRVALALGWKL